MIKSGIFNWKHGLLIIAATLLAAVSVRSQQKADEPTQGSSVAPDSGNAFAVRKAKAVHTTGNIPPEASVLSYLGPCDPPQKNAAGKGCKNTLTRAEIDTLLNT